MILKELLKQLTKERKLKNKFIFKVWPEVDLAFCILSNPAVSIYIY